MSQNALCFVTCNKMKANKEREIEHCPIREEKSPTSSAQGSSGERECQKSAKSSCQKLFTHRRMRPSHPKSRIESRGVIHHKVAITRDSLTHRARVFYSTIPGQSEIVCGINSLESFGRWGWTEPQAPAQVAPVKHHNLPNMNPSASASTRFSAAPIKSHSRTQLGITPRAAAARAEAVTISAAQQERAQRRTRH